MADVERTDLAWRKSEASADGACVEVAFSGDKVYMRQSKDPGGGALEFSRSEWSAFLIGARSGTFDLPSGSAPGETA